MYGTLYCNIQLNVKRVANLNRIIDERTPIIHVETSRAVVVHERRDRKVFNIAHKYSAIVNCTDRNNFETFRRCDRIITHVIKNVTFDTRPWPEKKKIAERGLG